MKKIILIYCFACLVLGSGWAQTKTEADSAYLKGKYEVAADIYEKLLQKGENATLYYNLGNAYYRMNNYARAILNYERAALRDPGNGDIRFNLALARSKTVDKVADTDQFFIFYWFHSLVNTNNTDGWAWWALIAFVLLLASLGYIIFGSQALVRKVAGFVCVLCFVGVVVCNVFALIQRNAFLDNSRAIIMQNVYVKSTPDASGNTLFALHPGTKVSISDNTMSKWKEITLPDGKKGWVLQTALELI